VLEAVIGLEKRDVSPNVQNHIGFGKHFLGSLRVQPELVGTKVSGVQHNLDVLEQAG
jgi:hypothetical protein